MRTGAENGREIRLPEPNWRKRRLRLSSSSDKLYLAEMERDLLKKLDEIERRDAFRK